MPTSIEFEKQMWEQVFINLPGPQEPNPGMSGGELLHGFLAELYRAPSPEFKTYIATLCNKWSIIYRNQPR